jgi:transposase-like protein
VQLCIVHLVRYSLNFVSWKERKAVVNASARQVRFASKKRPQSDLQSAN